MHNKRILASSLLLFALLLSACGGAQPTELPAPEVDTVQSTATPTTEPTVEPIALTDGLDRTITLNGPAQNIISLAPSNTEILFALGASDQVVGRDSASDYPEAAADVPSVGDTFVGLDTETILSLEPDLILAAEITPVEYVAELEELGLNVFWLANPVELEGLYNNLNIVGQLVGREAEADALITELEGRIAAVDAALANLSDEERPTVFYELDGSDPAAPWTAGTGTFINELIGRAGGVNIGEVLDGSYAQLSIEELLLQDPDIILLGDAAFGVTAEQVADRAGWGSLAAVQNGEIYPFDDNLASRPGPRLVDGLEELARLLHPELFN